MQTEREAFEAWAKSAPYEYDTSRFPMDRDKFSWPGQYRDVSVEFAWEAWKARESELRSLRDALALARSHIGELTNALSLVRMSAGWQYLSDESRAVIRAALKEDSE
jgi:hypothetical protein